MLEVDQALAQVLEVAQPLGDMETVPLEQAAGRVLAAEVVSDIDSPPHDKSLVDGFAVRSADLHDGAQTFDVIEQVVAGGLPRHTVRAGQATQIMTGAPLPPGADCVVMVEQATIVEHDAAGLPRRVALAASAATPEMNTMRRATSLACGQIVLTPGTLVRAVEVGLLAEVGCTSVVCYRRPRVAVLATGDELVAAAAVPAAGQIRNSNGPMLVAAAGRAGADVLDLGQVGDDAVRLREQLSRGLACDVLLVSGGVSAGVLDLAPRVLAELGVERVFHKIQLKPGKPLWFGRHRGDRDCLVFGLPGNPVGSLVCFELFVRTALARLAGLSEAGPQLTSAELAAPFEHRGMRPTWHPARLQPPTATRPTAEAQVTPLVWHGSGDLRGLSAANALAVFPAGDRRYAAGQRVAVYPLPE